ncbi:MAG: hypothetical protein KDE34_02955 [Anaerolineales bacterium]|nr:hypothetical protein [Anaerolineales bacterium]
MMSRQRLAWVIVLTGFTCFVILLVTIPFLLNIVLQNARRDLVVSVQANQGTLGIEDADGLFSALRANDPPTTIAAGTTLLTSSSDTALVQVFDVDGVTMLERAEVYGNSSVQVATADRPRFSVSSARAQLILTVNSGRVRLVVPPLESDDVPVVRIETPHGYALVTEPGTFSIQVVNEETQVTVQSGAVALIRDPETLNVSAEQRAMILLDGSISGPLAAERNLVHNGDFTEGEGGLAQWTPLAWQVERDDQSAGQITVREVNGQPSLRVERVGVGAAEVQVRQIIDADITGYEYLQLVVSMRILNQSLAVCGTVGSECPLTIEFEFEDQDGQRRFWRQGFYASGEIGPGTLDVCQFCSPPLNVHERVSQGQLAFYDSGNILDMLSQNGIQARTIYSLTLESAGHSFEVEIVEVALIAKE